ncbi:MAG: stage II sporulation protein D [Acutalibacteraceae bacterium]|nr:stage II sporulation protein D [Acutalibacteraceae bacterium]
MKNLYGYLSVFLCLVLLLFPLISSQDADLAQAVSGSTTVEKEDTYFRIKNSDSGQVSKISARDYVIGVVAAEMPALYSEEALKAQAVASYTYALYKKQENTGKDYDLTDSHITDQSFITTAQMQEKWGEGYSEYLEKITLAVESVLGKTVKYDGKYALTVYTAISSGKTEDAKNVWGKEIPYLTPTESVGDLLCPDYLSTVSLSADEIRAKIPSIAQVDSSLWFSSPTHSDSGTVLNMSFGETVLTGEEIRTALSLKSANFDVKFENDAFVFTVRGYGHLVGMSQYGANYMALQGSKYDEILKWYYKGCTVS